MYWRKFKCNAWYGGEKFKYVPGEQGGGGYFENGISLRIIYACAMYDAMVVCIREWLKVYRNWIFTKMWNEYNGIMEYLLNLFT